MANITVPEGAIEAMFGGERYPQTVADERFWFAHDRVRSTRWQPDIATLRSASTRVVVGIGEDSRGQPCERTSRALAARLDGMSVQSRAVGAGLRLHPTGNRSRAGRGVKTGKRALTP